MRAVVQAALWCHSNGVPPGWAKSGQRPDVLNRRVAGDDGDGDWKSAGHRPAGDGGDEGTGSHRLRRGAEH
jgi:hypothetical protein